MSRCTKVHVSARMCADKSTGTDVGVCVHEWACTAQLYRGLTAMIPPLSTRLGSEGFSQMSLIIKALCS